MKAPFYGKYRGVVTDTSDPLQLGRLRARVPDVTGDDECGWALPCVPFAGDGTGFFAMPRRGAGVWIEFEHGDPDYPIWTGCFWGTSSEVPASAAAQPEQKRVIRTPGGHSITFDDGDGGGGITLEAKGGQKITIGSNGIEITDGQGGTLKINGGRANVNDGALEVV